MKSIEQRAAIYFGVLEEKRLPRVIFEDILRELAVDLNAEKEKEVAELNDRISWLETQREVECQQKLDAQKESEGFSKEVAELRAWKESALKVMPDFQKLGKLLGLPLGSDVSEQLVPAVEKQTALLDEVKTIVERLATMPHIDQDDEFRLREGCKQLLTRLAHE